MPIRTVFFTVSRQQYLALHLGLDLDLGRGLAGVAVVRVIQARDELANGLAASALAPEVGAEVDAQNVHDAGDFIGAREGRSAVAAAYLLLHRDAGPRLDEDAAALPADAADLLRVGARVQPLASRLLTRVAADLTLALAAEVLRAIAIKALNAAAACADDAKVLQQHLRAITVLEHMLLLWCLSHGFGCSLIKRRKGRCRGGVLR